MCGLAGILTNRSAGLEERISSATSLLLHRSDAPAQYYFNKGETVALGHCRLSIIDLDNRSCQPFRYQDRFVILHNGEVYNYLELRAELEKRGYGFTTQSDTEVIVAAYAAYGEECLQKFEGMFAFAIWDEQTNILFAARDRFGEKPFYFHYDNNELLFGSEMKALWNAGVKKEVNEAMLYNYLTIGYIFNPYDPQETFYNNIYKLPAASYLIYNKTRNELEVNRYWTLYAEPDNGIKETDAIEKFNELLSSSIARRMRSDVPIGTSLSGGLDSSFIVAFANTITSEQYSHKCFTASFPCYEKDETAYAAQVADTFNLQHYLVDIPGADLTSLVEKLMYHHEVPFSSASAVVQYKVYEAARHQGVKVLLDGQGADEILGGYHKYYKWYWQELYGDRKLNSSGELLAARKIGVKEPFNWQHKLAATLPHFSSAIYQSRKAKSMKRLSYLDKEFAENNHKQFYYALPAQLDLNGALHFNTFQYGLEELLHLADRNSMAYATEVRLPFLDHHLVSFIFSLPSHYKIHNGWTKWLLRKVSEPLLPKEIVWRKDKVGFEPPQKQWMDNKDVKEAITEGKRRLVDKHILHPGVLNEKIKPHDTHAADNHDWKFWTASFIYK